MIYLSPFSSYYASFKFDHVCLIFQMGMGGQLPFSNMDPSRQQQVAGGNYQNMQGEF